MDRFYGFDLGDAESAAARANKEGKAAPEVLELAGKKSQVTAYALLNNGDLKIGEQACCCSGAKVRRLRFKSRFLTDPSVQGDIKSFAAGVLGELYGSGQLIKNEEACFYIGCPAGWSRNDRERYRLIFEQTGFPPVKIVSESRAALVSACQSKHLQVGYDILTKSILVIDIGSSTTDFAYVCNGQEVDIRTAGEVKLGGGIMDEILLNAAVDASPWSDRIRRIFRESEPWKNYCEFAARRLKEKYFSDPEFWQSSRCSDSVMIYHDLPVRLTMTINESIADSLLNGASDSLGGRSFREVFTESLQAVRSQITGRRPELIFLTGGVSRLAVIRDWCAEIFPDAVVIGGAEPEFSVARGLAWCGRIDAELKDFREDVEELKRSSIVEDIVKESIEELYSSVVDTLTEPLIRGAAAPVFSRWRSGEIRRLADADSEMQKSISIWLRSDEARELLIRPVTAWLKPVSDKLERHTMPICIRHNVPYSAMSLKSYMETTDIDVRIDAKNVFAVEEITWLIDSIVSVVIGLLCGGSGVALIATGLPGILIGFFASFLVLALGKNMMEKAILNMDIPVAVRKLIPAGLIDSRMDAIAAKVRGSLRENFEKEKDPLITDRMVDSISEQIEQCLTKMAEVVEIPLGS